MLASGRRAEMTSFSVPGVSGLVKNLGNGANIFKLSDRHS